MTARTPITIVASKETNGCRRTNRTSRIYHRVPCRPLLRRRLRFADGGLTRREARRLHPERRAGHVIEPDLMAELNARRVAAVLAADAEVQSVVGGLALLDRDLHQASHAWLVHGDERIGRNELALLVHPQELADVVSAEPECGRCEIVRAEREEV